MPAPSVRPELEPVLQDVNVWLERQGLKWMVTVVDVWGGESIIVNAPGTPDREVMARMEEVQEQIDLALSKHKVYLRRPDFLQRKIREKRQAMGCRCEPVLRGDKYAHGESCPSYKAEE